MSDKIVVNSVDQSTTVRSEGDRTFVYQGENTALTLAKAAEAATEANRSQTEADRAETAANSVRATTGKNLADPAKFIEGKRYSSAGGGTIVSDPNWRSHGWTLLEDGQEYTISGFENGSGQIVVGPDDVEAGPVTLLSSPALTPFTFTAAAPNLYLFVGMTNNGSMVTTFDGTFQIEKGAVATAYEPFKRLVALADVEEGDELATLVPRMEVEIGKNKFDETAFDPTKRYSTGASAIVAADANLIALSPAIPVIEGQSYTVSGPGIFGPPSPPQGGFFSSAAAISAVQNITWTGLTFTVPNGAGITHARISLDTTSEATPADRTLAGLAQVEIGTVATEHEPYEERLVVPLANLPDAVQPDDDTAQSNASVAVAAAPQPSLSEAITLANVNHIMLIGQSLAVGAQGTPVIHTAGWDANFLTFNGGPKALPVEAGGAAADTGSFKTLVEDTFVPDPPAGNRGETGLWVVAHTLAQSIVESTGSYDGRGKFVFTAPGVGGQGITFFRESASGTSWWQEKFLPSIRRAKAIADAASESYAIPVILWAQGEANNGFAGYAAQLTALFDEMAAAIRTETGQSFDPHFITYQTCFATLQGHPSTSLRQSTLDQVAVVKARARTHLGPPVYALPHDADDIHLTAQGYAMMGRVFGEQVADIIDRSLVPRRALFKRAFVDQSATTLKVVFDVTGGSLAFDTENLPAVENFGFRVLDDTGDVTLSDIAANGNEVTMTLSRALGANPKLRYALDDRAATSPSGASVATGNLRLSPVLPVPDVVADAHFWMHQFGENIVVPVP